MPKPSTGSPRNTKYSDDKNSGPDKIVGSSDALERGWLARQIDDAHKQVKKIKRHSPHLFQQYHDMNEEKRRLEEAKERYRKAKNAWAAL